VNRIRLTVLRLTRAASDASATAAVSGAAVFADLRVVRFFSVEEIFVS
jgi:hypothetical protein